jgi:hypothetical protein
MQGYFFAPSFIIQYTPPHLSLLSLFDPSTLEVGRVLVERERERERECVT